MLCAWQTGKIEKYSSLKTSILNYAFPNLLYEISTYLPKAVLITLPVFQKRWLQQRWKALYLHEKGRYTLNMQ